MWGLWTCCEFLVCHFILFRCLQEKLLMHCIIEQFSLFTQRLCYCSIIEKLTIKSTGNVNVNTIGKQFSCEKWKRNPYRSLPFNLIQQRVSKVWKLNDPICLFFEWFLCDWMAIMFKQKTNKTWNSNMKWSTLTFDAMDDG